MTPEPLTFLFATVGATLSAAIFGVGLGLLIAHAGAVVKRTLRRMREDDREPGQRW